MATLDELAAFAATAGSLTVGEDMFKGGLPATPDSCAAVQEYGGVSPDYVFGVDGISDEHPRFQVVTRGAPNDYATPRALAQTLWEAFGGVSGDSLSSTRYADIMPLGSPFKLLQDENGRYVIAFNCEAWKELS